MAHTYFSLAPCACCPHPLPQPQLHCIFLPWPPYLSTHTVYQYKIQVFHYFGGYGHTGKWIQENIIFMRFCCCFKLSKKIEKLSNEQPTHAIAKWTLNGLVQQAKKSCWKWDLKWHMCILHNIASSFHCHMPVGIQNATATSGKTKDPGLHKGNTGSQALD